MCHILYTGHVPYPEHWPYTIPGHVSYTCLIPYLAMCHIPVLYQAMSYTRPCVLTRPCLIPGHILNGLTALNVCYNALFTGINGITGSRRLLMVYMLGTVPGYTSTIHYPGTPSQVHRAGTQCPCRQCHRVHSAMSWCRLRRLGMFDVKHIWYVRRVKVNARPGITLRLVKAGPY